MVALVNAVVNAVVMAGGRGSTQRRARRRACGVARHFLIFGEGLRRVRETGRHHLPSHGPPFPTAPIGSTICGRSTCSIRIRRLEWSGLQGKAANCFDPSIHRSFFLFLLPEMTAIMVSLDDRRQYEQQRKTHQGTSGQQSEWLISRPHSNSN